MTQEERDMVVEMVVDIVNGLRRQPHGMSDKLYRSVLDAVYYDPAWIGEAVIAKLEAAGE